jgi:6-phosphogluconolactonase
MKRRSFLQVAAATPLFAQAPKQGPKNEWIAWIGTYTGGKFKSKGIYAYRWAPGEGKFTPIGLAVETVSPSFLAVHPNQQFLYAVNEVNQGEVSAFKIDAASGQLKLLNKVSSKGAGPCHLVVERNGRWVYTANYNNGSVAALPIQGDGSLGQASAFVQHSGSSVDSNRQKGPQAHATVLSPDNRYVLVADLGLDQVLAYPIDADSGGMNVREPVVTKVTPGSGPRHLAFRPDGKFVYVLGEMSCTVTSYKYNAQRGLLEDPQTVSTLPDGFNGTKSGAEIAIRGNTLYASNRGPDTIASFRIDPASGRLTAAGQTPTQGKTPRNFAIDPTGNWLVAANQDSETVVPFKINANGALSPGGEPWAISGPVCVVFSSAK